VQTRSAKRPERGSWGSAAVVVGRAVAQQGVVVGRGRGVLVALVARDVGQHVTEYLVEPTAQVRGHPFGLFVHPYILPWCHDGRMASADKVKIVVDNALRKVGEYSDKASEKAAELAEKAAEKAGELTEVARERAPGYLDRAAELAGKAADATAASVDRATGGRYHGKIDSAHEKLDETLQRVRNASPPDATHHVPDAEPPPHGPGTTASSGGTAGPSSPASSGGTASPSSPASSGGTASPSSPASPSSTAGPAAPQAPTTPPSPPTTPPPPPAAPPTPPAAAGERQTGEPAPGSS
jgi:hypothetical protein